MADNVKFIFKTLLKVPIIIFVIYAVFNVFAFSLSYFKILGFSYVAMQTAVENSYIPEQEMNTLENYLFSLQTEMLDSATLLVDTGGGTNTKVQYGTPITVTVSAHYRFIWPLMPHEQKSNGVVAEGMNGQTAGRQLTDAELDQKREEIAANPNNNIVISYTVPGLKYYPDLG